MLVQLNIGSDCVYINTAHVVLIEPIEDLQSSWRFFRVHLALPKMHRTETFVGPDTIAYTNRYYDLSRDQLDKLLLADRSAQ